ncbi:sugar 3,4-ketoisomerase [Algoriphagus namhaensis]
MMLLKEQKHQVEAKIPFVFKLHGAQDPSGKLNFWQQNEIFPSGILRCFWVYDTQPSQSRGNHAHKSEIQVIVAVHGRIRVEIENRQGVRYDFELTDPSLGLYLPPQHWVVTYFGPQAVLLGMCNESFSEEDYIRNYKEFKHLEL